MNDIAKSNSPDSEPFMITVDFELTKAQNMAIIAKCIGKLPGVTEKSDMRDFMRPYAGMELAHHGVTHFTTMNPEGRIRVTLDDITPTAIEFVGGDDPVLKRKGNRDEMENYLEQNLREWRQKNVPGAKKVAQHFSKLIRLYYDIENNIGSQPDIRFNLPAKKNERMDAVDAVIGDTLEWESVFDTNHPQSEGLAGHHHTIANVVGEGLGENGKVRTLSLEVFRSFGENPYPCGPGKVLVVSASDITNPMYAERRRWKNEGARDVLVRDLRKRGGLNPDRMKDANSTIALPKTRAARQEVAM